jgi:small conductance mechanosensitive channel
VNSVGDIDVSAVVLQAAQVAIALAGFLLLNASIERALRTLTRRRVRRALNGRGRWHLRLPRPDDGRSAEKRRIQRADAAAHMLSRMSSVIVGIVTAIVVLRILGFDPVVLISSAGFLGVAIAFGGQSIIHDWLRGLLVLLEDRYAVGDRVSMRVTGDEVVGTVEMLGGAGVRLRLPDGSTWHTGHASVEAVTNLSQQLVRQTITVPTEVWAEMDETTVGQQLNAASHDLGLTGVLLVNDIVATPQEGGTTAVTIQASRHLTDRQLRIVEARMAASHH